MKPKTFNKATLYDRQVCSLFTQLICETESLYQKVMTKIQQKSQSVEIES